MQVSGRGSPPWTDARWRFGSLTWRDSRTATAGRADAWLKVPREVNHNPPARKGRRCPGPPIGGTGANFRGYRDEAEVAVSRTRCVVEWERGCDESDWPIGLGVGAMLQFGAMKSRGLIANRCV